MTFVHLQDPDNYLKKKADVASQTKQSRTGPIVRIPSVKKWVSFTFIYFLRHPMQKDVSLFLSYTNMNNLYHVKEYPKIIATYCNLRVIAVNVSKLELLKI